MKFPKIKKSIESYIKDENGKISKQSLITMGAFIGSAAISGVLKDAVAHTSNHINNVSLQIADKTALGQHTHHASY